MGGSGNINTIKDNMLHMADTLAQAAGTQGEVFKGKQSQNVLQLRKIGSSSYPCL